VIEDLIRGLATGSDLSAEEILDVLWLSAIRAGPRPAPAAEPAAPPVADHPDDPERERASPPDNPPPPPTDDDEGEEAAGLLLRLPDGGPDSDVADANADSEPGELIPAAEVGFGAPRPIRDAAALPRALRRLRQVRRPGPRLAVDVDATVEATADAGGTLVPVFSRPLERSLDLALVVDGAPAMRVWDDTFDELTRLMAQTGAFRSVERWRLITDGTGTDGAVSLADASGKVQPTHRLIDPSGRRVVFVATSASAEAWYTPGPWEAVAAWAAAMPTALIQVLPRQYWAATALGEPYVTARAGRPAAPNAEYAWRLAWWADDPGGVPLPVVTLAPDALETWAQAAVSGTAWTIGVTATPPDPEYAPSAAADEDADVLVNDFLGRASPGAERLARILATASTLSMPLIAVLQESLAPETGVLEVAEVLSSGLLEEEGRSGSARFRFRDDTRQLLRRGVTAFEEWDAYAAVSRYLESRHQLGGPLSALIPDPDGTAALDPAAEPFAALHEALATRLGLRTGPDHPPVPVQPTPSAAPTGSQAIPESLLAALVDEISGLRPNDILRVFALDATGAAVSQIGRDKHGTPVSVPWGALFWSEEDSLIPGLRPPAAGKQVSHLVLIHKSGAPPDADNLAAVIRGRGILDTPVSEYYVDTDVDVARAINEAIARCPLTRSYELLTMNGMIFSKFDRHHLPLFPPGAVRGDRRAVRVRCQPSDGNGTVFAVTPSLFSDQVPISYEEFSSYEDFSAEPMLVMSAKVPAEIYDVTAELLGPGAIRFEGLPVTPRTDPRPWPQIMATLPERIDMAGPVHLIFAVEADAPGPAMSRRLACVGELISATAATGAPVRVSVVLYGWQSAPGFSAKSEPLVLVWTADTRQAEDALNGSPILLTASAGSYCDIEQTLRVIADRLAGDELEGRPVLVTIGLRPTRGDWYTPLDRLLDEHPGITFGAIVDAPATAESERMWDVLAQTALELADSFSARRFASALGLLTATPTPVPFPLSADLSITRDTDPVSDPVPSAEGGPSSSAAGDRELSLSEPYSPDQRSQVRSRILRLGRAPDSDFVVTDLLASNRHAELRVLADWYEIVDRSRNGTFVNDARVNRAVLEDGDVIAIGNSRFQLTDNELREYVNEGRVYVEAVRLERWISDRGISKLVLRDITFPLAERSLLAVIGPPGAGKTTLCQALTGVQPASSGVVRYDGRDLYQHFDAIEHRIGVVPQERFPSNIGGPRPLGRLRSLTTGIFSPSTPRAVLSNAAKQRFARDTTDEERNERVDHVLSDVLLTSYADVRLDRLGPREEKRTDLGLALLTDPAIVFLDEPFAPIPDSASWPELFQQLRAMANPASPTGRSVVVFGSGTSGIPLAQCDRLLVLTPGGRMAYYGPSSEGLDYFGKQDWADVYQMFREYRNPNDPPRDFPEEFRASRQFEMYVAAPMA
jgi:ABC-type multidrug transport system ATPase subunit